MQQAFDSLAQRCVYNLRFMCRDSTPMARLLDAVCAELELLALPHHPDEAWEGWEVNNRKPALDKAWRDICKKLYNFYKFLYTAVMPGESKARIKPLYGALLEKSGVHITDINQWTPVGLTNFVCGVMDGDFSYLLTRMDGATGHDGYLTELGARCLAEGYTREIRTGFGATGYDFSVRFSNGVGGFIFQYNPRKYQRFSFGTQNGIGEKAMLEDFANLDADLQAHFLRICGRCRNCMGCTKGGKNKIFTVDVCHKGEKHALCPQFPNHWNDRMTPETADTLFKYHAAQLRYAKG